ncbi:MAG: hypothetical protein HY943_14600 [Gammaproteobacteria bacterium]|nr:hypothetical protein [Gammaproteobacteria bacterium]
MHEENRAGYAAQERRASSISASSPTPVRSVASPSSALPMHDPPQPSPGTFDLRHEARVPFALVERAGGGEIGLRAFAAEMAGPVLMRALAHVAPVARYRMY